MKRLISFFILLINVFIIPIFSLNVMPVRALSPYLRVITTDTPFYSNQNSDKPLFYLPYTYYVRVIREELNFYYVEYGDGKDMPCIDGYVPKEMLFDDGLSAISRYPSITIKTSNHAILYLDTNKNTALQYVFKDRELTFYGIYTDDSGETLYYVSYNNKLGYVSEEDVIPFTIPNHPNDLTFIPKEEEKVEDPPPTIDQPKNTTTLRYLIIGCLALAGIFALVIAFNKKPSSKQISYYEESEYE